MSVRTWEVLKVRHCEHADSDVQFEADVVYPADFLSEQAPRVLGHRCSNGTECARNSTGACKWCGANPDYDPFL